MTRILTTLALTDEQDNRLRAALGADSLDRMADEDQGSAARDVFDSAEIVFGNPPAAWVAQSPLLRWLQLESVGFGEYAPLDWERLAPRLQVTNLAGFFAEPVAESILAGVLALYRGIDRLTSLRDHGEWQGDGLRPALRTLQGAAVVLFGHGAINARAAELLSAFQCRITAFRRGFEAAALDAALVDADVVISTVPDTPATRNIFDRERLSRLKAGAVFVNFGRGSVVDDEALADRLDSGALGGAVIDVTREEPLPVTHPFWRTPRTILTQHSGGGTGDEIDRKINVFLANLDRYRRGEPLNSRVDFSRGY